MKGSPERGITPELLQKIFQKLGYRIVESLDNKLTAKTKKEMK